MSDDYRAELITDEYGRPLKSLDANIFLLLYRHPDMAGMFGTIDGARALIRRPPWDRREGEWEPRPLEETDILGLKIWLQECGLRPTTAQVKNAVNIIFSRGC